MSLELTGDGWRHNLTDVVAIKGFPLQQVVADLGDEASDELAKLTHNDNKYLELLNRLVGGGEFGTWGKKLSFSESDSVELVLNLEYLHDVLELAEQAGATDIHIVAKTNHLIYLQCSQGEYGEFVVVGEALIAPKRASRDILPDSTSKKEGELRK